MKYEKATAEVVKFNDPFGFIMGSAGVEGFGECGVFGGPLSEEEMLGYVHSDECPSFIIVAGFDYYSCEGFGRPGYPATRTCHIVSSMTCKVVE